MKRNKLARGDSTVVVHLTHNNEIESSNPAGGTGKEKKEKIFEKSLFY
jgi:hypothetical protein